MLAEPTRRFSHTSVSSSIHLSSATEEKNPEYSIILSKTYLTGENKKTKDMQGYLACGLLQLQKDY
jgi:hypothetical protein